jgi:hypothetical protein
LKTFLSTYSPGLPFNEEFIFSKMTDDVTTYIDHISRTLEVIPGIKYIGSKMVTDESKLKARLKEGKEWISLEESRLNRITIEFELTYTDKEDGVEKTETVVKELLYPKLLDGFYFVLNGVQYYPIYQVVDSETFRTAGGVTLKTMIMPISLRHEDVTLTDQYSRVWSARVFRIRLFEKVINALLYYLISKGFQGTLEYFGITSDDVGVCSSEDADQLDEEFAVFPISKGSCMYARASAMEESQLVRDIVACLMDACGSRTTAEKARSDDHWKRQTGALFARNAAAYVEKAERLTVSFERILDTLTKSVLRIDPADKEDVYSVVRWMIRDFDRLYKQDNMDLSHKRIRLHEYLLNPLLMKWALGIYRILNSKQVGYNDYKTLFSTLGPGFLIKKLMNNDLLRYSNSVNGMDLFNSALKFSMRGPQSLAHTTKNIAVRYRGIHPSYVGRIALNTSSNSDPGLSGTFCPFIGLNGYFFSDNPYEEIAPVEDETGEEEE